ncbi:hypothetical protein LTS15_009320 [Exophiala xenobiotica]|nr:hypothetical protein LTS15_009320 [Exophiala xenobiotica]
MSSQKRITKELGELMTSPPAGISVALADESNLFQWKVTMEGPAGSPYAKLVHQLVKLVLLHNHANVNGSKRRRRRKQRNYLTKALRSANPALKQGGKFDLSITLPQTYPFKPPTVTFATKIYHPNISNDSPPNSGTMCLGMLKDSEWKPSTKMAAVLEFARQLLKEPNPDDAVEAKIAEQYRDDRAAYEKEAKEWVKRHASGKK